MEPLPCQMAQEILQDLQDLFNARPDQIRKRKEDQMAWGRFRTKNGSGMQSPTKRAKGRFFAMVHHIFGLQVAPVEVDVGALSPDVTVSKIHSVAVLGVVLNHGVLHWKNLVSMRIFSWKSPQSAPLSAWRKRTRFWSASKATPVLAARLLFSLAAQCTGCGKTP